MRDIEQELRSVSDMPVPPSTTALDDVLRRGRRRVLVLRAGAAAGVVAVVAGTGIGLSSLRSVPTTTPPAVGPSVTSTQQPWPAADLPPQVPYGTWSPASTAPPGDDRAVLDTPMCSSHLDASSMVGADQLPPAVADAVRTALTAVARPATVGVPVFEVAGEGQPYGFAAYRLTIDVTDSAGTGSVAVRRGRFEGTPLEAADAQVFLHGNCAPANRVVKSDGTVLQYYSVVPSEPFQSLSQALRIYRPNGFVDEIVVANYGSPDIDPDLGRVGRGRATLPLTVEQLKTVGLAVALAEG